MPWVGPTALRMVCFLFLFEWMSSDVLLDVSADLNWDLFQQSMNMDLNSQEPMLFGDQLMRGP